MSKMLFVVGAFDRYNYGDLLFPVVIEAALKTRIENIEIVFCSPLGKDYTELGSVKSISYKQMFEQVKENDLVMVAGGGVLSALWFETFIYLYSPLKATLLKIARRLLPSPIFNMLLSSPSRFPYVFDSDDFGCNVSVFYNAVGGTTIEQLSLKQQKELFSILNKASYLAVRDNATQAHLSTQNDISLKVKKVPDSVAILSDIYPLEVLRDSYCSDDVNEWIKRYQKNYFCIQIGKNYLDGKAQVVADALMKVYRKQKMPIVLLPIGTATGHEDDVALKAIEVLLDKEIEYFYLDNINLYNTMALIGSCAVFAGTSLHGAITSMSYAVPHFTLTSRVKKLANYVATWDVKTIHNEIAFEDIADAVLDAKHLDTTTLNMNADKLKKEVYQHFDTMTSTMQGVANGN